MPAPSSADIVVNPDPLNPVFAHPLPVLAFPGDDLTTYGDMFDLAGDTGQFATVSDPTVEPSQH